MRFSLREFRSLVRRIILEDSEESNSSSSKIANGCAVIATISEVSTEKKKPNPMRMVGKVVMYLDRPFRITDVHVGQADWGGESVTYRGMFDDDSTHHVFIIPAEKTSKIKRSPTRAKKPEDFDDRAFVEQDIEHFLRARSDDGRQNIEHVRERWAEISNDLSWMEKYIFEHKWMDGPMSKTNEQIAQELASKLAVVRAAESRAFKKIERFVTRDDELDHDLKVIKHARAMHKAEQPLAKIIVFLQSELKNHNWMNELDFLK